MLEILIDHAVATGIAIPFDEVFHPDMRSKCMELTMRKGFIPMLRKGFITSLNIGGYVFYYAAGEQLKQTMSMMLAQSPILVQLEKLPLKYLIKKKRTTFTQEYVELLTKLMLYCPSLQSQCKARILTAVGDLYMEKVSQLPLPKPLIGYLQSLESYFTKPS